MESLSEAGRKCLLGAKRDRHSDYMFFIERTLGWLTWSTQGERGHRKDVAELYRLGLVAEYHSPWSPPLYLTEKGMVAYHAMTEPNEKRSVEPATHFRG